MRDRESRYQFGQTRWSLVFKAGKKEGNDAVEARNQLLIRYFEAVHRYLVAKLGDSEAAGELFSRFAERVVEIHPFLERADPEKGRFRDYLKAVLHRMVIDYHRERQRQAKKQRELAVGSGVEPVAADLPPDEDDDFRRIWCEELMNLAYKELEAIEQARGQPFHSLLLYKAINPTVRSDAIAKHFSKLLGREMTADNIRQLLHRGQELLSDLLIKEVARSLREKADADVTADRIEEELRDLSLLDSNRKKALDRYRAKHR